MRALVLIGLLCIASTAWAGLIGTSVTGSMQISGLLTNYYDPANGFVPAGYLNSGGTTVTIAEPAIEFGYQDSHSTVTTNFTNTQLFYTDVATFTNDANIAFRFTDSAFDGISLVSTTFATGLTYSFNDDTHTITINTPYFNSIGTQTAIFDIETEGVPEPATLWLFGAGLALMAARRLCWSR